ncbi:hypothetical protein [Clostridium sp.]|uniref:hypothetical protein n=1 Tax=Clostridium sp. TaxID=1506 RepID=UPI0025BD6C6F|nr:hypothetical protein [Clostridium sp.]
MNVICKKIFLISIKYLPLLQMFSMILNNILYLLSDNFKYIKLLDFVIGNSLVSTILLYVCSITFNYCNWHRLLITANFINLLIAALDYIINFNVTNLSLILIYITIDFLFIILCIIYKFKCK